MEPFELKRETAEKLAKIESLINEGVSFGLDMVDILDKLKSVKSAIDDGVVRIALLGSFSDGKTSAIAGLLGRLEDNMKIDQDESSDELTIYRPLGLKKGFEIVDTPGLFGTKSKEIDGRNVKFSDITKKYISEAHIVVYVCDAVTPLKESHVPIIKWVMRDLKKINSTIFVINKMDEAGYDLLDPEEFQKGTEIKKQNLISRLRTTINLSPDEERKLHIVCIAADPKGKGLAHWFSKTDDYLRRSHIELFRDELNKVVNSSNVLDLSKSTIESSLCDMMTRLQEDVAKDIKPMEKSLTKCDESCKDLKEERAQLKAELAVNKSDLQKRIDEYKNSLYSDINGASAKTIVEIVEKELGVQDDKVSFYIFTRNLDTILSAASNNVESSVRSVEMKFERSFNDQEKFLKEAIKGGSKYLKNIRVSNTQVLQARDMLFSGYKFRPWGATKWASNITKGFGYFAVGISVLLEAYEWWKQYEDSKKLKETKAELRRVLDDAFASIYGYCKDEESFVENFAPNYIEMGKMLQEREKELAELRGKMDFLKSYNEKIKSTLLAGGEYVDYKEV